MSKRKTTEEFINESKKIHGNNVIYDNVEYIDNKTKVCLICPKHGVFWQTPSNHLKGKGCPSCFGNKKYTSDSFIEKSISVHNNEYDYSEVNYVNISTKICLICKIHGKFWQTPRAHLVGQGCPLCYGSSKMTKDTFVCKANKVHNGFYDYSNVEINGNKKKIKIICPIHGSFYQTPIKHLYGQGCPYCKSSHLEDNIRCFLTEYHISFKEQYSNQWLGLQTLDFYLPDYNIGIECQGIQHFKRIEFFGGEEHYKYVSSLDEKKLFKCKENNVRLLYYSNLGIEYPYEVFEDKEKLLEEIKRYGKQ